MDDRPRYMISVAAELVGMHPQTLRVYEEKGLVRPKRTAGNTRLYSEADLERLRLIQRLTTELGLNLAGVEAVLELEAEVGLGVETRVPRGALRADEPLLLVHAQGLRVHPDELGCDGDHVARSVVHHARSRKMRTATELIASSPMTTRATATSASAFSQPGRGSPS